MLEDDDFDDVDGLVGSCGMSFQIDAWERIKKSYKELTQQTGAMVPCEHCKEMPQKLFGNWQYCPWCGFNFARHL